MKRYTAAIFDLDGVLVDTARYHYLAWNRLAEELGFTFTRRDNERLKGVSRSRSLDILLEIGNRNVSPEAREKLAARKNGWYVEYLMKLDESEILPGARELLQRLRQMGIKTALGSASRNAQLILERLNMTRYFDAVIDGNRISRAKPDPEIFLCAAEALDKCPEECVVFEDARAGIEAAKAAGMYAVGVGNRHDLPEADQWVDTLKDFNTGIF